MYNSELQKPEGLSAKQVSQLVLGEFGVEIKARTIQREICEGRVGVSPKKMGPQGYFPPKTFNNLVNAFESYIKIMQMNGHGGTLSNNKLKILLKKLIIWILCLCHPLLKFLSHRTTWRKPKEKTTQFMRG